jgi:DNA-binding IclR family transcriptional regulator
MPPDLLNFVAVLRLSNRRGSERPLPYKTAPARSATADLSNEEVAEQGERITRKNVPDQSHAKITAVNFECPEMRRSGCAIVR